MKPSHRTILEHFRENPRTPAPKAWTNRNAPDFDPQNMVDVEELLSQGLLQLWKPLVSSGGADVKLYTTSHRGLEQLDKETPPPPAGPSVTEDAPVSIRPHSKTK